MKINDVEYSTLPEANDYQELTAIVDRLLELATVDRPWCKINSITIRPRHTRHQNGWSIEVKQSVASYNVIREEK